MRLVGGGEVGDGKGGTVVVDGSMGRVEVRGEVWMGGCDRRGIGAGHGGMFRRPRCPLIDDR